MLVLMRRRGEKILISGGIEIEVVEILRNKVRIGITAPGDVAVVRDDAINTEPRDRGEPC